MRLEELEIYQLAMEMGESVWMIVSGWDFFAKDRILPKVDEGDCLAVMGAGAYGFSMSSNYNSRCRAQEVMIDGNKIYVIRKRETYKDLISNE